MYIVMEFYCLCFMLFCYQKIDGEHGKEKDFDFLSSIEVSSFDPTHYLIQVFLLNHKYYVDNLDLHEKNIYIISFTQSTPEYCMLQVANVLVYLNKN